MKKNHKDTLKFHLDACRIEPRFIERGLNDGSDDELEDIFKTYVIPLESTWSELTPDQWTVIAAMVRGAFEIKVLTEQRKALRNAWKALIRSKNEKTNSRNKKSQINSDAIGIQPDKTGSDENSK